MDEYPLVSVIIPCFNTEEYIAEMLESLFKQTYQKFEVIAIDDGSTDRTLEILKKYEQQETRLKVIAQENTYCIIARQNAIVHAKGKYLVCLDSDDKLAPEYLAECVAVAEADSQLAIVYTDAMLFGKESKRWDLPDYKVEKFLLKNCIYITALIRKSAFDAVGGFDVSLTMYEDWDLFISLIKNKGEVYKINKPYFFYRKRANKSSVSDTASKEKESKNLFKIYSKHYDFYFENGIYFQDLMWARYEAVRIQNNYYNRFYRKLFYKWFKPKKYQELYLK